MSSQPGPWITMNDKVRRRTIAVGENLHQIYVHLAAGAKLAEHTHVQEQVAFVVKGKLRLIVEGKPIDLGPGESYFLKSNIPHAAEVDVDTEVLDSFSPPRQDMLEQDRKAR